MRRYRSGADMKKIMAIFGTRPEAIKMCPLVRELWKREGVDVRVCVSGQHREMLSEVLDAFGVRPDHDLSIMRRGQTLTDVTVGVLRGVERVLELETPDAVLVHGDTSTALASALACFYRGVPVGHVEAGLRTYDVLSPYPEELNRRVISLIARLSFAPTELAADNLLREGAEPSGVFVTGNTVVDALHTTVREDFVHPLLEGCKGMRTLILTAHRRENQGAPMKDMLGAVRRAVEETDDVRVIFPVHPSPLVRQVAGRELGGCKRIILTEPLGVIEFHNILARCYGVLTDSGGIQEEAAALGIPVLVMRESTERPEGVLSGGIRTVGKSGDGVYRALRIILDDPEVYASMKGRPCPYGDGSASVRIADALLRFLG